MSSDEDEGDGRRYNRYESDDEGDVEGTYDEDAWNDSRKRRRGQTKEQAIYGIFGDDDDDDRDDRGAPVDYTAPVNFRSAGGTGGGGAGLGAGKEPEDMFADDDEDAPPTAGLGARGGIGSGAGLGSFASQGGAGLGFGGFSKGNTITSTVENDEEEARTTRGGLGSSGLGFGSDGTGFGGGGLGFAAASGGGDGEEDGPAAGALNPMDVDENDSDDEDLLPSTFGQRCAPARLHPNLRDENFSRPTRQDRYAQGSRAVAPAVTNFILRQRTPRLPAYRPGDSPSAMRAIGLSGSATSHPPSTRPPRLVRL